jgi:hypothetical protein
MGLRKITHAKPEAWHCKWRRRGDRLGDSSDLPGPAILAAEIVEDPQATLDQFARIAADLAQ